MGEINANFFTPEEHTVNYKKLRKAKYRKKAKVSSVVLQRTKYLNANKHLEDEAEEGFVVSQPDVKGVKEVNVPYITVVSTGNNTHACLSNTKGKVLYASSCGKLGFKGAKRSSVFAAQVLGEDIGVWLKRRQSFNKRNVAIELHYRRKGIGQGKEAVLRGLLSLGIPIRSMTDITGVSHGGVRSRKRRRL